MKNIKILIKWLGITIGSLLLERLINLIPIESIFVSEKWNWIIRVQYNMLDFVIFILSFIIILFVYKLLIRKLNKESRVERELKKFNSITDEEKGIKITWDMYMGAYIDNDPHPCNIRLFCIKHDIPQLLNHGRCTDVHCPNSIIFYDETEIKRYIESLLLNKRDILINR